MDTTEPEVLKALTSGTANDSSGADSLSNMNQSGGDTKIVEHTPLPLWVWGLVFIMFLMWSRL
jgi:hypothetical protein